IRLERMGERLFYRDFAYLNQVLLIDREVVIKARAIMGVYRVQTSVWEKPTAAPILVRDQTFNGLPGQITLALPHRPRRVRVEVTVEGDSLAYDAVVTQQSVF